MKLSIESTDKIVRLGGVDCRHWVGRTDMGTECHVFVHRVAVRADLDLGEEAEFADLHELVNERGPLPPRLVQ